MNIQFEDFKQYLNDTLVLQTHYIFENFPNNKNFDIYKENIKNYFEN